MRRRVRPFLELIRFSHTVFALPFAPPNRLECSGRTELHIIGRVPTPGEPAMTTVEAIYEGGVFKPLGAVKLAEHQRVQLVIRTDEPTPRRGVPVEQVRGIAAVPGPPPDDETIDRWRDEYLAEKYL